MNNCIVSDCIACKSPIVCANCHTQQCSPILKEICYVDMTYLVKKPKPKITCYTCLMASYEVKEIGAEVTEKEPV